MTRTHARDNHRLVYVETGHSLVYYVHRFSSMGSPRRGGLTEQNSKQRAPAALPPPGVSEGCRGSRVKLIYGLVRTIENPTSLPTAQGEYDMRSPPASLIQAGRPPGRC